MYDKAILDFETRSPADLKHMGSQRYSKHPKTEIMCLGFNLPGDAEPSLWHDGEMYPGSPRTLDNLFDYIRAGGIVEAHNAIFDSAIWQFIAEQEPERDEFDCINWRRGMGAPPIQIKQWRCSAARAAAFCLPRDLKNACEVMGLIEEKDSAGHTLMLKMCKPRKPRKNETSDHTYYWELPDQLDQEYQYCLQDIRAQKALSKAIPELSTFEYRVWLANFKANRKGIRVDEELCHSALSIHKELITEWNRELKELTGIRTATQRAQIKDWLVSKGVKIKDTTAATLNKLLCDTTLPSDIKRIVEITCLSNKTSIKKYQRILEMSDNGRVFDLTMYHGATTGRETGKGIQVHNLPKSTLSIPMEKLCEDIKSRNLKSYPNTFELLSSAIRGSFIPSQDKHFFCADYSAIEARVVAWLAGEEAILDIYHKNGDMYCTMASTIYRRPITKRDEKERAFGKIAILGLGFGIGYVKFFLSLRQRKINSSVKEVKEILTAEYTKYINITKNDLYPNWDLYSKWRLRCGEDIKRIRKTFSGLLGMARLRINQIREELEVEPLEVLHELALCKYVVDTYRTLYDKIPKMWKDQENAAISAVENPGIPFIAGRISWIVENNRLYAALPTGRRLVYHHPAIEAVDSIYGTSHKQLTFWGVPKVRKAQVWVKLRTYGGSLTENLTQATARDVMMCALVAADESPLYAPIMTVHDELLAETEETDLISFNTLMTKTFPELSSCPLAVESAKLNRYQK